MRLRCSSLRHGARVVGALTLLANIAVVVLLVNGRRTQQVKVSLPRSAARSDSCVEASSDAADGMIADLQSIAHRIESQRKCSSIGTPDEPFASVRARIAQFVDDETVIARLSAARFDLDAQLAALHESRHDPGKQRTSVPPLKPPAHEADIMLPEPSTFVCRMLPDGFEVCEYENVCFDVPGPALGDITGRPSQTDAVYFVGSEIVPSFIESNKPREKWRHRVAADAAPAQCRGAVKAMDTHAHLPSALPRECLRWLRHWLRLYPLRDNSIPWAAENSDTRGFDAQFEDIERLDILSRQRVVPFGSSLHAVIVPPNQTLSVAHGGAFAGVVTWVDNLYLARDVLEAHLWGWSQSVTAPLLSAHWANHSAAWGLPPIDNLLVYGTPAWKKDRLELSGETPWLPHRQHSDAWAMSYLRHALSYIGEGRPPWRGVSPPEGVEQRYPWLDAIVDDITGGGGPANGTHTPLPFAIPYEMTRLVHPSGVGTRMIFSLRDLPLPPDLARAGASGYLGGDEVTVTMPQRSFDHPGVATTGTLHTGRRRICGRRAVALGEKPFLISGGAEGNAFRQFAYDQLGVPRPIKEDFAYPPRSALVVDRGPRSANRGAHDAFKTRSFSNLPEMLSVMRKYNVSVEYVTDEDISQMSFVQQAALFGKHGMLIMAHGAGLSNAFALPQRACVIEIYPRGMWCDLYRKMLTAQGARVFPIYSSLLGPKVEWTEWQYVLPQRNKSDPSVAALAKKCEAQSLTQVASSDCWREYRYGAIYTPIAEFERTLITCLELLGVRTFPRFSPIDMIEGVLQNGPGVLEWGPGVHEANQWVLCPPPASVLVDGGRMGSGAHRCMYPNGTWVESLPGVQEIP